MNIDKTTLTAVSRCLSPKHIITPYGSKTVPCGKCRYCQHSAKYRYKTLLQNELANCPAIYFTLTYAPKFLPLVKVDFSKSPLRRENGIFSDYYVLRNKKIIDFLSPKKVENYEFNLNELKKYSTINSQDIPQNHYAVYNTEDIQLFTKLLRKKVFEKFGETFRFYCLAEYGGKSMRPHYHFIIFGKNASKYFSLAKSCWSFGFIYNSGTVNSSTFSLSSYLSSYLSSNSTIPTFLTFLKSPKIFHSKNFGYYFLLPFVKDFLETPSLLFDEKLQIYTFTISFYTDNNKLVTTPIQRTISPNTIQKITCNSTRHNFSKSELQYYISQIDGTLSKCIANFNNIKINILHKETLKVKIPYDFIFYLFPNIFGKSRNITQYDEKLLRSYNILRRPNDFDNFVTKFLQNPILYDALGFNLSRCNYSDSTPIPLRLDLPSDSIEFLVNSTNKSAYLNNYFILEEEFKKHYQNLGLQFNTDLFYSQLTIISKLLFRLSSIYYQSKHFCKNILPFIPNFKFYHDAYAYYKSTLEQKKLRDLYSLLEYNSAFPYEYFLIDSPINFLEKIQSTLLPLQTQFLQDIVKHKEINNRNENLFNTSFTDEIPF